MSASNGMQLSAKEAQLRYDISKARRITSESTCNSTVNAFSPQLQSRYKEANRELERTIVRKNAVTSSEQKLLEHRYSSHLP
jgi:DNA polymerase II small subunit/DNA polymerase delta subunit B